MKDLLAPLNADVASLDERIAQCYERRDSAQAKINTLDAQMELDRLISLAEAGTWSK